MKIGHCFILVFLAAILHSCLAEPSVGEGSFEGECTVDFTVDYRPLQPSLDTKAAGDLIRSIDNISVVVYHGDGTLYMNEYLTSSSFIVTEKAAPGGYAESKVHSASFQLTIPRGMYRIYAVVNLDAPLTSAQVSSEDAVKAISLNWKTVGSNVASAENDKMFGFFTADDQVVEQAPSLRLDAASVSLHAWVRRTVSKVTVSYDASNLNENVYIYLKSVQIRDIPSTCLLGASNVPSSADQLIAEGEKITYSASELFTEWPRITRGNPIYGSDHSETAEAMYFFENNQGTGSKHNYHPDDASWDKDRKPYGTYIEVKAYYINRTDYDASHGEITYRFMLGQDVTEDFNAARNNHYKITLCFNRNANEPDWHIVYDPVDPELKVPDVMYISYGYNKRLDIPAAVIGGTESTITAEISSNPWWYEGHKYANYPDNNAPSNGFLNLEGSNLVKDTDRTGKYVSDKTYGRISSDAIDRYTIPVYTRPMTLGASYSGYNYYEHHNRQAQVKITAKVNVASGGVKTITKYVNVIQVERLLNPGGVWRRHDNESPFKVVLTIMPGENQDYIPLVSEGPWTARIIKGAEWVRIKDCASSSWGTYDVTGSTGSVVQFDYKPDGTISESNVRCGIIEVLYHNNNCSHYVFVRQGYAPTKIGSYKWHSFNMWHYCKEVTSPCSEGCMFKFGTPLLPIKPQVNFKAGYGFNESVPANWTFTQDNGNELTWTSIGTNMSGFTKSSMFVGSTAYVATYTHWDDLAAKCQREYGVLYADGSSETKLSRSDAHEFLFDDSIEPSTAASIDKGMRGVFMYEPGTGTNLFLPIGATGYGHRQKDSYVGSQYNMDGTVGTVTHKYSVLKYAQAATELPPKQPNASGVLVNRAITIPMYYDLYRQLGAIYFYRYARPADSHYIAWDINFSTCGFEDYLNNAFTGYDYGDTNTGNNSDMGFVRCVED